MRDSARAAFKQVYPDATDKLESHQWYQRDLEEFRRWYWENVEEYLRWIVQQLSDVYNNLVKQYLDDSNVDDLARHLAWWHRIKTGRNTLSLESLTPPTSENDRPGGAPTPADVFFVKVVEPVLEEAGVFSLEELRALTISSHPVFAFIEDRVTWETIGKALTSPPSIQNKALVNIVLDAVAFIWHAMDIVDGKADQATAPWEAKAKRGKKGWARMSKPPSQKAPVPLSADPNWRYWEPVLERAALWLFPDFDDRALAQLCVRLGMERVHPTPSDILKWTVDTLDHLILLLVIIGSGGALAPAAFAALKKWGNRLVLTGIFTSAFAKIVEVGDLEDILTAQELLAVAPMVDIGVSPKTEIIVAIVIAGASFGMEEALKKVKWNPKTPPPHPMGQVSPERAVNRPVRSPRSREAASATSPDLRATDREVTLEARGTPAKGVGSGGPIQLAQERATTEPEIHVRWQDEVADDIGLIRGTIPPETPPSTGLANEPRIRRLLEMASRRSGGRVQVKREQSVYLQGDPWPSKGRPKGSSVPEWEAIYDGQLFFIELKSYARLLSPDEAVRNAGIRDLARRTVGQIRARAQNIGTTEIQYIWIDLTRREYGSEILKEIEYKIRNRLVAESGGIITGENIAFFE